jgi:hypothetical protein
MHPGLPCHEYRKPFIQNWDETREKQHTRIARNFKFGEGKVIHLRKVFSFKYYTGIVLVVCNQFILIICK